MSVATRGAVVETDGPFRFLGASARASPGDAPPETFNGNTRYRLALRGLAGGGQRLVVIRLSR